MAATHITNRNRWDLKQDELLLSNIAKCSTKTEAYQLTSNVLGRSVTACTQRYAKLTAQNVTIDKLSTDDLHVLITAALKQKEGALMQELTTAIISGLKPEQVANYRFLLTHLNLFN